MNQDGLPGEGVGREDAARLTALLPDPVHMTRQHVIDRVFAALDLDPDEAAVSSWARALVLHVELVHGCEHTGQLRSVLDSSQPAPDAELDVERLAQVLDRYPMWWEVKRLGGKLVMTKMVGTAEAAAADIAAEYDRLALPQPGEPT